MTEGYGVCVYMYSHRAFFMGFYNGPVQSRRQTVMRSYGDCAVSVSNEPNERPSETLIRLNRNSG